MKIHDRVGRRRVLHGAFLGISGLATAALIGCSEDDEEEQATAATSEGPATSIDSGSIDSGDGEFPLNFPEPEGLEPKSGHTLIQAVTWDVGPLDPAVSSAGGSIGPARAAYNRLIGFTIGPEADAFDLGLEPELASSWESAPDGLSHTFYLNEGIRWQNVDPVNGRAFTAADVKFVYDRHASGGAQSQYFWNVENVAAPDDRTVLITLREPQPDFLIPLASRYLTIHPREIVDDDSIGQRAIGTGPMILKEALAGQRVVLERNPDYWQKEVLLDGIEHRIMPDAATRLAAFRTGQIDLGLSIVATPADVDALLGTNPETQVTLTPVLNTYFAWSFNLTAPRYQDERVRRALSLALDREGMIAVALPGTGAALPSIPWIYLYDEAPTAESGAFGEWWRYAPDEASQLLEAAGASDLAFELLYTTAYGTAQVQLNEILVDQMRQVGVTVNLNASDYTAYNSQWTQVSYTDVIDGWGANGFDADNFFWNYQHSSAPGNRYYIDDPEIDEWSDAQRRELDQDTRRELQQRIWDKVLDQVYRIDKPYPAGFDVQQPWVRNVRFTGPNLANYSFTELGAQAQYAWLNK